MQDVENILKIKIGKRIDQIRKEKGMSKDKFAELIGVSPQHLGKVISGESGLSVEKIVELSEKTCYPTDYILLGKEISFESIIKNLVRLAKDSAEEAFKNLETLSLLIKWLQDNYNSIN